MADHGQACADLETFSRRSVHRATEARAKALEAMAVVYLATGAKIIIRMGCFASKDSPRDRSAVYLDEEAKRRLEEEHRRLLEEERKKILEEDREKMLEEDRKKQAEKVDH